MKKIGLVLVLVLLAAVVFSGCDSVPAELSFRNGGDRVVVTATLFPEYDFARAVGGEKASVRMLLPPGTESHTFDPSPADAAAIQDSDIFFYTGDDMEPWASRIVSGFGKDSPVVVDASANASLLEESHDHGHEDDHGKFDPHIWLDLDNAIEMVEAIRTAFCDIDPDNSLYYSANADAYKQELKALDDEFRKSVEEAGDVTLVFGGRFAYGYMMERYGIKYISAYETCAEEGEPSVRKISEIIDFIRNNDIKVIYYEELSQPKVAKSIADETGCKMLEFSTAHTVTKAQFQQGVTFTDIMQKDLESLQEGLR